MDLRNISLELYLQDIQVILKGGSRSYKHIGNRCQGILTGRLLGIKNSDPLIAILLKTDREEIHIPCEDISFLIKNT